MANVSVCSPATARAVTLGGKTYQVCGEGFLVSPNQWDENFAEAMAPAAKIPGRLTQDHWAIIRYIRETLEKKGKCPLVYDACHVNGLYLEDLQRLFPTGYQRGACKLAGVTYRDGYLLDLQVLKPRRKSVAVFREKIYRVDVRGFLVDPEEWDEEFAAGKALEMKLPGNLTDRHWQVIGYLRDSFSVNGIVPTVYDVCQANAMDIDELERLFPDGYHRGLVRIAGLRI